MNADNRLSKVLALASFLARRPALTFNLLSQAPNYIRGWDYANRYDESVQGTQISSTSEGEMPFSNRLRDFFNARTSGRGIWKWLHYFDLYERHLHRFVGREVHIMEVGVYSGGSLEMWRDYFGDRCRIYGVDIQPACKAYESQHVQIHIGNQADRGFWKQFKGAVPTVDVLVDDGGHSAEQQIVTLEEMLPHLRPGGVYICEDIHGPHNGFSTFAQGLINCLNSMEMENPELRHKGGIRAKPYQAWVGSMHFYPYLTVIEKAEVPTKKLITKKHGTEWQPFVLS